MKAYGNVDVNSIEEYLVMFCFIIMVSSGVARISVGGGDLYRESDSCGGVVGGSGGDDDPENFRKSAKYLVIKSKNALFQPNYQSVQNISVNSWFV